MGSISEGHSERNESIPRVRASFCSTLRAGSKIGGMLIILNDTTHARLSRTILTGSDSSMIFPEPMDDHQWLLQRLDTRVF